MKNSSFKEVGLEKIEDIRAEGWGQIDFIEVVFKEWVKINQLILDKEYKKQNNIERKDGDLDRLHYGSLIIYTCKCIVKVMITLS